MTNRPPDPIRDRLRGHDPLHRHPHPIPPEPPAHLLEQIMTVPTSTPTSPSTSPSIPPSSDVRVGADRTGDQRRSRRRRWQLGGAGVGVAAAIATAVAVAGGGSSAPSAIELGLGDGGATASCMAVDAAILADMPLAFAGEVAAVDGEAVTLDVSTWYVGGDAHQVVLTAPAGMEALIGGIEFVEGEPYLVSATEGVVNYCGYTGPATADLQAVYDAAFPG